MFRPFKQRKPAFDFVGAYRFEQAAKKEAAGLGFLDVDLLVSKLGINGSKFAANASGISEPEAAQLFTPLDGGKIFTVKGLFFLLVAIFAGNITRCAANPR